MTPFFSIKGGTVKVPLMLLEDSLQNSGFRKYQVSTESMIYMRIENNKVAKVTASEIYEYVMDQAKTCALENEKDRIELVEKVSSSRCKITSNLSPLLSLSNLVLLKILGTCPISFIKMLW